MSMRCRLSRLTLLFILMTVAVVVIDPAFARPDPESGPDGERLLLEQIRLGEVLYRDDVVTDAVTRLYRIRENHPLGLLAELRIATRLQRLAQAEHLLERLQRVAPDSPEAHTGTILLKLATPEAMSALAQGRLYSAVGRVDEALEIYDAVLEGVYPTPDLNLEYWLLYARQPGKRPEALQRLQAYLELYPVHAPTLNSVASMLFSEDRPDEALQYLRRLAALDSHREVAAAREFEYLATLDVNEANRALWHDFVVTYAGLDIERQGRAELRRFDSKLDDPAWQAGRRGVALIEQGEGAAALAPLQQAVQAWPDDVEFLGSLGVAYLRTGDRSTALHYFELARDKEPRVDRTYRWVSLIRSTRYWMLLEQASAALERQDWPQAGRLYRQAHALQPDHAFAIVGRADVAMAMGQDDLAWQYYRQALRLDPDGGAARRGVSRYLDSKPPAQALALLDGLAPHESRLFDQTRQSLKLRLLTRQANAAIERQDWEEAGLLLLQARHLDPDDPWLSYSLARVLREQGRPEEGLRMFDMHLTRHRGSPASHYAHGLLLAALDRWQESRDTLVMIPRHEWDERMRELEARVVDAQLIAHASALRDTGQTDAAIAALEQRPESVRARLQVAQWSYDDGDFAKALSNYNAVLRMDSGNIDARLGQLETWLAQGKPEPVRAALARPDFAPGEQSTGTHRRVAALWVGLGETAQAKTLLQQRLSTVTEAEPLLYRDLARLERADEPERALDLYAAAMRDADLLPAAAVSPQRDDVAFTRSMHGQDTDGWLERGLRRESAELYERRNPVLSIH
ncbi:MAG TPA: tetratricopeptide repeat protein, partial [Burkholderiaceae bacterium]|nr:tetratricopeptide repeat protein [Burkholderiaceae bacterium]